MVLCEYCTGGDLGGHPGTPALRCIAKSSLAAYGGHTISLQKVALRATN